MDQTTQTKPYIPSATKLAHVEVLQAWIRLTQQPNLAQQNAACRVAIEIGALTTYWSCGMTEDSPAFLQTAVGGAQFVFVYLADAKALAIYEKIGRIWRRSALLRKEAEILAALPKRALQAELPAAPATEKQIAALRKFLGLSENQAMPVISGPMCSRLIDRMTVERALVDLRDDFANWTAEQAYAPSIEA